MDALGSQTNCLDEMIFSPQSSSDSRRLRARFMPRDHYEFCTVDGAPQRGGRTLQSGLLVGKDMLHSIDKAAALRKFEKSSDGIGALVTFITYARGPNIYSDSWFVQQYYGINGNEVDAYRDRMAEEFNSDLRFQDLFTWAMATIEEVFTDEHWADFCKRHPNAYRKEQIPMNVPKICREIGATRIRRGNIGRVSEDEARKNFQRLGFESGTYYWECATRYLSLLEQELQDREAMMFH